MLQALDVLLILPTAAGKSLCYQLPAVVRTGYIVVITPLISLAHDQMASASDYGIYSEAFNCSVSEDRKKKILSSLTDDDTDLKLLFTTPESLESPDLREALSEGASRGLIIAFAVDEAHTAR